MSALFDGYNSCEQGNLLMLVFLVYCASHVSRCFALRQLQKMHQEELNIPDMTREQLAQDVASVLLHASHSSRNRYDFKLLAPPPRQSIVLLLVGATLTLSSTAGSIADYNAKNYPAFFGPFLAALVTFGYTVAHVSFVCCLVLILAAVEGARQHVKQAADDALVGPNFDCAKVRPRYMRLVKQLRSHCSFVRTPSVLAFTTLWVSSLASGIDVWYIEKSGTYSSDMNIMLTASQCVNFACWSFLMLGLLWHFLSVREEIKNTFVNKIKEHFMASDPLIGTVMDRQQAMQMQNELQSSLDLITNLEPAGWFLMNSQPIGERIFNFNLLLVLFNGSAKIYEIAKELQS